MRQYFAVVVLLVSIVFISCSDNEEPTAAGPELAPATPASVDTPANPDILTLNVPARYHPLIVDYANRLMAVQGGIPDCIPCQNGGTLPTTPPVGDDDDNTGNDDTGTTDPVYVTPSGTKFHKQTCRYAQTATAMPRAEAIEKGYTACKTCNP